MNILHRKLGTPAAFTRALNDKHNTTLDSLVPLSASRFPTEELVEAYTQTRADYVIPMPMSKSGFEKYTELYDIDLDLSTAVMDTLITEIVAMGLLAIRGGDSWISRLGVVPLARSRGVGTLIAQQLFETARRRGIERIWMELIDNSNLVGRQLVDKLGFKTVRELIVARRPPNLMTDAKSIDQFEGVYQLGQDDLLALLAQRKARPSWINQTETYAKLLPQLAGFHATIPEVGRGWVIYEDNRFQLRRLSIEAEEGNEFLVTSKILEILHQVAAKRDASLENLPADSKQWVAYQGAGYFETFRRAELCATF